MTIIWDYDGVISDTNGLKKEAFVSFYSDETLEIQRKIAEYHEKNTGVNRFDKFKLWNTWTKRPTDHKTIREYCSLFGLKIIDKIISAPFNPHFLTIINNGKYKHAIATAGDHQDIEKILQSKNIDHLFEYVKGGPGTKTEILKDVLLNISDKNSVFIGDSISDYKAALNMNVPFLFFLNKENLTIRNQIPKNLWIKSFKQFL
jgi:phosphoglycolate phosphatase-like HAD superfamily hydrolase